MKTINIKPFTKNMSAIEKSRLLIADLNCANETEGKERLLTPQEEYQIEVEAQKEGQTRYLNNNGRLYNATFDIMVDMQIAYLIFALELEKLVHVISIITCRHLHDADSEFGLWDPPLDDKEPSQPSKVIQISYMKALDAAKTLESLFFKMEYVQDLCEVPLLRDSFQEKIKQWKEELKDFCAFEGMLMTVRHFRPDDMNYDQKEGIFMDPKDFVRPEFLEAIRLPQDKIHPSDEELEAWTTDIQSYLKQKGYTAPLTPL